MPRRHETLTSLFSDIADAIRAKTGGSADIVADNFDTAIAAIPSGGGSDDYFYIECVQSGSIKFAAVGTVDVALQYSTDKTNWTNYTLGTFIDMTTDQKIYWKNNKNYLCLDSDNYVKLQDTNDFKGNIGGRINSLINNIDGEGCYPYAFTHLFADSRLINASELILGKYVNISCYQYLFDGCTSLTTAPELPATILADHCYNSMFYDCTSLITAPELPATTLRQYCYSSMFYGCTSLTTVPEELPATTLPQYCYNNMFRSCTSLTTAPNLPATTLATSCYNGMFRSCTSLTTAPNLPATTLQSNCYNSMFYDCTSLKVYSTSGEGHDKAWSIPSTGPITGTTRSQSNMFSGVQTDNVPANFPGTSGQQFTYYTQNTPV